jgi:chromosome segregation ATPase
MRETRLEKIRSELEIAQAAASQCRLLEQQLEQCNAEWRVKFDQLEARCRQSEAVASGRISQAVRDAEAKSREETEILRRELQVVRAEGDRALEESQLRNQEQIDRLKRELQDARMARQSDPDVARLRADLENQKEEISRRTEELRMLELHNAGLVEQLRKEKAEVDSRSLELRSQRNTYEVDLRRMTDRTQELLREIAERTKQRDQLEGDLKAFKAALKQREEECNKLRENLKTDKKEVEILQLEVQSSKDKLELDEAKDRLFSPRNSMISPRNSMLSRTSLVSSGQQMIDVDMTEDMEFPTTLSGNMARLQLGSMTTTTRYVIDVQEED